MKIREYFGETRLNPEERKYLVKKLEKIRESVLSNYGDNEIRAEIRISQDKKKEWSIEVTFKVPKSKFEAARKGFGLTETMDSLEEVLTRQILRKKEKIHDLRKRGSRSIRKKRTIDTDARF